MGADGEEGGGERGLDGKGWGLVLRGGGEEEREDGTGGRGMALTWRRAEGVEEEVIHLL